MTFFEAAVEVLRTVGRPLDYKTITQLAINRQLLGHVGHTPDVIMASCLLRAVARCDTGAIIRLESGEFALRGWSVETLAKNSESTLPANVSGAIFPPVNVGLLETSQAVALLEEDDVQFRKAVRSQFDNDTSSVEGSGEEAGEITWDDVAEHKFEDVRSNLNDPKNDHFNLCAAIVKTLRATPSPMQSANIAALITQKTGSIVYEQSVVLAMRADNALRVSRGKRAMFLHIQPDLWTLTENCLTRHILKIESQLYDLSRQLRTYSLHAITLKLRDLVPEAWFQLAAVVLKHLNYTLISHCALSNAQANNCIIRAEEARGLTYIPVLIKVISKPVIETEDVLRFRDIIREFGYDHGVLMGNGDISRDALNECTGNDLPIYVYAARQIAPIMLEAKIGVTPNNLPIVFLDHHFFDSLLSEAPQTPSLSQNPSGTELSFTSDPKALPIPTNEDSIPIDDEDDDLDLLDDNSLHNVPDFDET